ncbi:MAG: hypothetical protein MJ211_00265 [Bacteroidales bacterium]|nr:hypothetical protein [Bacteroidales bacterium]
MRKIIPLLIVLMISKFSLAQSLSKTGTKVENIVPNGWVCSNVKGDLNKDGISDLVIIATPNFEDKITIEDDFTLKNSNPPILAIYWGNSNKRYTLYKQYENIIPFSEDQYSSVKVDLSVTNKGVLRIGISYFQSAESFDNSSTAYLFRYQNNDFYLIGEGSDSFARNTGDGKKITINYSTLKRQIVLYNMFDESIPKEEKWETLPNQELKKLGSFKLE